MAQPFNHYVSVLSTCNWAGSEIIVRRVSHLDNVFVFFFMCGVVEYLAKYVHLHLTCSSYISFVVLLVVALFFCFSSSEGGCLRTMYFANEVFLRLKLNKLFYIYKLCF